MSGRYRCRHRSHLLRIPCLRAATYGRFCYAHNGCGPEGGCLPLHRLVAWLLFGWRR